MKKKTEPVVYTKEKLVTKLKEIEKQGWVKNARKGNHGGAGNTLEDLLGIEENNLPIPNAAEWELKTQKIGSESLCTLFHMEPSPRAVGFVPKILLPKYGWKHKEDGKKYKEGERSFRQTIGAVSRSDRGFMVKIDPAEERVVISFDPGAVDIRHKQWLSSVKKDIGLKELDPQPYWGFYDLEHKAGTKLLNAFYVEVEVKNERGVEYYHYKHVTMLQTFNFNAFLKALKEGKILVDFDARTGHNHGTKFRMRPDALPDLYKKVAKIF